MRCFVLCVAILALPVPAVAAPVFTVSEQRGGVYADAWAETHYNSWFDPDSGLRFHSSTSDTVSLEDAVPDSGPFNRSLTAIASVPPAGSPIPGFDLDGWTRESVGGAESRATSSVSYAIADTVLAISGSGMAELNREMEGHTSGAAAARSQLFVNFRLDKPAEFRLSAQAQVVDTSSYKGSYVSVSLFDDFFRPGDFSVGKTFRHDTTGDVMETGVLRPGRYNFHVTMDASAGNELWLTTSASVTYNTRLEFSPLTCEDLLRGSVQPTIRDAQGNIVADGTVMQARFEPPGGLQVAKEVCEVHHFNWVNAVIDYPTDWTYVRFPAGTNAVITGTKIPRGESLFDPNFVSGTDYAVIKANHQGLLIAYPVARPKGITPDNKPLYYQEAGAFLDKGHWSGFEEGDNALGFADEPRWSDDLFGSSDSVQFATALVGVDEFGNIAAGPWTDLGTNFFWKSNSVYAAGNQVFGLQQFQLTIDDGTLPPIKAGGVFDVQSDVVPEPSTFALAALGLLTVLAYARRKRRSR